MSTLALLRNRREAFLADYAKEVNDLQAQCPHNNIGHWDGFSEYSTRHPIRICLDCGFEEEGGWWCYDVNCTHWHAKESGDKKVLRTKEGRTINKLKFEEVMRARP